MKKLKISVVIVLSMLLVSCSNGKVELKDKTTNSDTTNIYQGNYRFVNPPIKNINVPYQYYVIEAEKGKIIYATTGSSVYFPPNAFVDKEGKVLKGEINIAFREFTNPFDFYIAGIPMNYDTLKASYTFESSGMCEINATKDSALVYVNPNSKPKISLISTNNSSAHNLYYLDTIQKKWVVKGKSNIKNKTNHQPVSTDDDAPLNETNLTTSLVKPLKANVDKSIISVNIPYVDFVPELKIFKNTKFEVDDSEKNYNPKDGDVEWDRVRLEETETKGIYSLVFSTAKRKVAYRVRPVYEGNDYTEALKIYNDAKKNKEELNRIIAQQQIQAESEQRILKANRKKQIEINRIFEIEKFGIWNCDQIININTIEIFAKFIDKSNNKIDISQISLVNKALNGVFIFNGNTIRITPNSTSVIWGIYEEEFYYFTYKNFKESNIDKTTKEFTFQMNKYPNKLNNYNELKEILEL